MVRCAGQVVSARYQPSTLIMHLWPIYRLGDIREGRCDRGIFYNQTVCCSGLDCEYRILKYLAVASHLMTSWGGLH